MSRLLVTTLAALLATSASAQPLPRATPLALDDSEERAVLQPIDAIFVALEAGDAARLLANVHPEGRVTATGTRSATSSGLRSETWADFAARLTPATAFRERLFHPAVEIDGDVAMVWGRFVVHRGGRVANCGYDHFDLIRDGDSWKVMNLSFSSRITDCGD